MHYTRFLSITLPVLLSLTAVAAPARAAESYDSCVGFIDALPATISTQGVWCLRKDLATNITNGNALSINANNVTIDCNHFKIGGLAAGDSSNAVGIYTYDRHNTTVRNCSIRGFHYGILLYSGSGHLVEDNRLDNNLEVGIYVAGANIRIRRNAVYDTGGFSGGGSMYGIVSSGHILDNIISGVFGGYAGYGIVTNGNGNELSRNHVQAISGTGEAIAIWAYGNSSTIAGNRLVDWPGLNGSIGIKGSLRTICTGNTISGFTTSVNNCLDAGDNISN